MYNLIISLSAGFLAGFLTSLWLGWLPSLVPAMLVAGITLFVLARRTARLVQAEVEDIVPLLQAQKIDEARQRLLGVQAKYGKWQILLSGQLDAQMGMLDYMMMKWDDALPRLQKGTFQNWSAQTAVGCIQYRKGDKDSAFTTLTGAAKTAPKEIIIYLVHATLLNRSGKRPEALTVLDEGLKAVPDSKQLKTLRKKIANKKRVDTSSFPETWYQFFPEEMAQKMMMRGRRGTVEGPPQPRFGARHAPRR